MKFPCRHYKFIITFFQTTAAVSKKKLGREYKPSKPQDTFSHKWLLTTLKGHSGSVLDLDLSENGKYLASCATDRTVLVWYTKDFASRQHKSVRGNVSYDHGTKVKWSPDSKAFIVNKCSANCCEVYKINRKEDGSGLGNIQPVVTFPNAHSTDVIGMGFASTGKFVMTCSDVTTMTVWSIKGDIYQSVDTCNMNTYCAKVSPCGRFVASSGFTPDVKVWEVKFTKQGQGEFDKVTRAFELNGHGSGVYSFDFNADSSRMVTLSKDGHWRLFDTHVEFHQGQNTTILTTGDFKDAAPESLIAISPDSDVVVIAGCDKSISWFAASSAELIHRIENVHSEPLTSLIFDKESKWLLTAGDKHIRVFHNVPGYKIKLEELERKYKAATNSSMRERLSQQISQTEDLLKSVE